MNLSLEGKRCYHANYVNNSRVVLGIAAVFLGAFLFLPHAAQAATFTVNSTEDTTDGTCVHPYVNAASDCTLREAIIAANAAAGADTIVFAIDASFPDDGDGQWTITETSAMTSVTGVTTITAASAWDVDDDRPGIKLARVGGSVGFTFTAAAAASKVQGLEMSGFTTGISIAAASMTIGTDCDGSLDARERNVLYGATTREILVSNVSSVKIRGNYIAVLNDGVTASSFGSQGIQFTGASADNGLVGYEEGTSGTCAASAQRNVIGGGDSRTDIGIQVTSGAAVNLAGDASVAPDGIHISGNYIGVGSDGITDITGDGNGIQLNRAATLNYIGTDGDGVDDDLERNVIGGWGGTALLQGVGIVILQTGSNLVSGNVVGIGADGATDVGNGSSGMNIRGTGNIVGWCDTSVHATLCFDGGSVEDERNIVSNNGVDGIRFGYECNDCIAYGNIVGTDEATQTFDYGNADNGFFVHRGDDGLIIGGPGSSRRNVVMFNDDGILIDGLFTSSSSTTTPNYASGPTENYIIENNVVSQNSGYGIYLYLTELEGTVVGPTDGSVLDNVVEDNGLSGIFAQGSSPLIDGNSFNDNGTYGIEIGSQYHPDDPPIGEFIGLVYSHPTNTNNPNEASEDLVGAPTVTNNDVDGNATGGIYLMDADASNIDTLETDNTIGTNGSYDIARDWYVAVEVLGMDGDPVISGATVTLKPAGGLACVSVCSGSSFSSAGGGEGIWGPSGIDYTDASTWFLLREFGYDNAGIRFDYSPYKVTAESVGFRADASITFDGDVSDDPDTGHLPAGITTASVDRYQIGEASLLRINGPSSVPPRAPTALAPVALDDHTIRWYFRDEATDETGFSIEEHASGGGGVRVIADSGPNIVRDLSYLDETNLDPETVYCQRYAVAYNGVGTSTPSELPCARTLAAGQTASVIGTPDVRLIQEVWLVPSKTLAFSNAAPSAAAVSSSIFLLSGILFAADRRRKGCSGRVCRNILGFVLVVTLGAGATTFILADAFSNAWRVEAQELIPIDPRASYAHGDRLRFVFTLANAGTAPAANLRFEDTLPSGLFIDSTTLMPSKLSVTDQRVSYDIPILGAGESHTIQFDAAVVELNVATLTNLGTVRADNVLGFASNAVNIRVAASSVATFANAYAPVKGASSTTVYMIGRDGLRHPFINEAAYFTWFGSFSFVRVLSDADLARIPLGKPALTRPGTVLVKTPLYPAVYAVTPGEVLRWIPDEGSAEELFGADWSSQILDLDEWMLARYARGPALEEGELPSGMLVTDQSTVCYLAVGACREVTENGLTANRFQTRFIRPIASSRLRLLKRLDPLLAREDDVLEGGE